jgi:hypothetical protein
MSNEMNLKRKLSAAESRWEAVQMQAANAQRELDYAIAVVEQGRSELTEDQKIVLDAQINIQKETIKEYLMKGRQVYAEAVRYYESGMSRLNAKL